MASHLCVADLLHWLRHRARAHVRCSQFLALSQSLFVPVSYDTEYGPEKKSFEHSMFLVWAQCVANGLFAIIGWLVTRPPPDRTPMSTYASVSVRGFRFFCHSSALQIGVSYGWAMFCSNWALSFVDYPTQALGKSCKLIPGACLARHCRFSFLACSDDHAYLREQEEVPLARVRARRADHGGHLGLHVVRQAETRPQGSPEQRLRCVGAFAIESFADGLGSMQVCCC